MKVVVTGSRGFIGTRLTAQLTREGYHVTEVHADMGGGILDYGRLLKLFKDAKVVFHLGCISGSKFFDFLPYATRVNCEGTANVLEACRVNDVKKVVFASSSSCYAFTPMPHKETNPTSCVNAYVATKLYGERLMKLFWELYGVETVILRYASVYGIGEEKKGSVSNPVTQFLWSMMERKQPVLYGEGEQKRDLIFVDDVVSANIHSVYNCCPGEIYNVSTNIATSFNEVVQIINSLLHTTVAAIYIPYPDNAYQKRFVEVQWLDNAKLVSTGWKYRYSVADGLKTILDSLKKERVGTKKK